MEFVVVEMRVNVKSIKERIVFFGGKGGVGKSSTASAYALKQAADGRRTLLVSTDPAHNLGDLFERKLSGGAAKLTDNLWGMEIDPEEESKRYIEKVKSNLSGLVKSHLTDEVNRQMEMARVSPGADEAALFDRIVELVLEEGKDYDLLVFDTAPTGHTLRLLSLPEMMEAWVDGMLQKRQSINDSHARWLNDGEPVEDPIYRVLMERKDKFSAARKELLDPEITRYHYVLVPEKLPIAETERAVALLKQTNLTVDKIVVNKCLPEAADDSSFFQNRRSQEKEYLDIIQNRFLSQTLVYLPMLDQDVRSIGDLEKLSKAFSN